MPATGGDIAQELLASQRPNQSASGKFRSYAEMPGGYREAFLQKLTAGYPNGSLQRNRILNAIQADPSAGDALLKRAGMYDPNAVLTGPGQAPNVLTDPAAQAKGAQGQQGGNTPMPPKRPSGIDAVMAQDGTGPQDMSGMSKQDITNQGISQLNPMDKQLLNNMGGPAQQQQADGGNSAWPTIVAAVVAGGGLGVVLKKLMGSAPDIVQAVQSGKLSLQDAAKDPRVIQAMQPAPSPAAMNQQFYGNPQGPQGALPSNVVDGEFTPVQQEPGNRISGPMADDVAYKGVRSDSVPENFLLDYNRAAMQMPDQTSGPAIALPDQSRAPSAISDDMMADEMSAADKVAQRIAAERSLRNKVRAPKIPVK